jgi:hypothetical protein
MTFCCEAGKSELKGGGGGKVSNIQWRKLRKIDHLCHSGG